MRPHEAFDIALKHGPDDLTRNAAAASPRWAFMYAILIDCCSHPVTKDSAYRHPRWRYRYSFSVEKLLPAIMSPMPPAS